MKSIEVVAAIIIKDDKIFAAQRGYGKFQGWWEFPGGKIEKGESHEEALKREIKEELDADIKIEKFLKKVEYDYDDFHLVLYSYICKPVSESLKLLEHENSKWLPKDQLKSVEWLPADLEVIDLLQKK